MAARNNDAALDLDAAIADHHGAARRGGGFPRLRDRRLRAAAVCFAAWGAAGILSTTVPTSLAANPHHAMAYFVLFLVGVLALLLSIAAPDDLP